MLLVAVAAQAQIKIGGSVYGGGNEGDVQGATSVTVNAGDLNKVYGGARMADVGGSAFVNIDGNHMSGDIIINYIYGGNDISGTVGSSTALPAGIKQAAANGIDNSYNAFLRTSAERKVGDAQPYGIFIGQLFGGGNGDYTYRDKDADDNYIVKDAKDNTVATSKSPFTKPELGKAYLEITGGTIAYLYGGGNNATVTGATDIYIDNKSTVTTSIPVGKDATENLLLMDNAQRLVDMGIPALNTLVLRDKYQFSRVFGGNNKADMAIMPTWHLKDGKIDNLYSGGNEGRMTSQYGILLDIKEPDPTFEVNNVYGGCRKADVCPGGDRENPLAVTNSALNQHLNITDAAQQYKFPDGFSARVIVRGGKITNVYGGNDISGKVFGGNAVGVYASISGDVYGGGNGSYPYTDNASLKSTLAYGDYYYNIADVPGATTSVDALNAFRPNAEQVSIYVKGKSATEKTIIGGSVYCGGNSATIKTDMANPTVEMKFGSHVIADRVFLGNNGANMVTDDILTQIAGKVTVNSTDYDFSQMTLTDEEQFAKYMEGCAMSLIPTVDSMDYVPYSTMIGSFYCGGNVGSMTYEGTNTMDFSVPIYIYNKVVGGCNNAIVPEKTGVNARYEGGILGTATEQQLTGGYSFTADGNIRNRLVLNFGDLSNPDQTTNTVKFLPMRWIDEDNKSLGLEWNTVDANGNNTDAVTTLTKDEGKNYETSKAADLTRRFKDGHIYGGCYDSGVVNGNVVINLNSTTVDRDVLFDKVAQDELGEASLYGDNVLEQQEDYHILERRSGVILGRQGMDVLGDALNVFGGGKGKDTEIWGSTTINLNAGYTFQVFGGSEEGVIGRSVTSGGTYTFGDGTTIGNGKTYKYDPKYSCTINLRGESGGVSKQDDQSESMAEAEFIYGGGFFGPICGNTVINLGNGRVFDTFAGSCMADILGHTETYIGRQVKADGTFEEGFPYIRDMVYGGNDLGGQVLGEANFSGRVRTTAEGGYDAIGKVHNQELLKASAYVEYTQGRADAIFGGCYGTYDYTDDHYRAYFDATGTTKSDYTKPRMGNAFVNFRPTLTNDLKSNSYNTVKRIYGAGQGYPGDADRDIMQRSSYILIDIPQTMDDGDVSHYRFMEVFGGGAWSGLGMEAKTTTGAAMTPAAFNAYAKTEKDRYSANIDLARGFIGAAYGGSLSEGVARRTWVNVPTGSTIKIGSIFAGAYGTDTYSPCDVIEGHVEYHSGDACLVYDPVRTEVRVSDQNDTTYVQVGNELMKGAIYGGNNQQRRTVYGIVNIDKPVRQSHHQYGMTTGTVYGAGYGSLTWNEYTQVNLEDGAKVYEVYGGGEAGGVMSAESVAKYYKDWMPAGLTAAEWKGAWTLGGGYDGDDMANYASNNLLNLNNSTLVRQAEMDNRTDKTYKYNTNVIIGKGAYVGNYAYGGGRGYEDEKFYGSGDVYGTTYIALLGGQVNKDLYAAGTVGAVYDLFDANTFTASANAYIAGGTLRNVYGGGWKGDVGYTSMNYTATGWSNTDSSTERPGETNVVIGIRPDQASVPADYGYHNGVPAIQRNAYSGGEGGAVFGKANLVLNNGYIGYVHLNANQEQDNQGNIVTAQTTTTERYEEKITDETYYVTIDGVRKWAGKDRLKDCGNMFGGGYDVRSCVDESNVTIWNGTIRNSVHGGGEVATIGRGSTKEDGANRTLEAIYGAGKTCVTMYNGHVKRNVFGGGKGYNVWGYGQQGTLYTDGYVFGQTEVQIHGGKIGTEDGVAEGYGNVFGGGDIGYVYSKGYFSPKTTSEKAANPNGSTGSPNHWYYYGDDNHLTEDCKVVVSPYLQVKTGSIPYGGKTYSQYDYVPTDYLNTLHKKSVGSETWPAEWNQLVTEDAQGERGVHIYNAVFAGGNVSSNSDQTYANATTIYGNTTATLYDVYHRDFITVGTEHTGGLYGGGNLSLVNGYRELNITNYGTDYYGLESQITLDQYRALSSRERAYFKLEYICQAASETSDGKTGITLNGQFYETNSRLSEEDYLKLLKTVPAAKDAFTPYGFCSIYAGRLLNTIQRADMCGVYGSRMVLQGAKDRVTDEKVDVPYTINRVGELSLNQQRSVVTDDVGKDSIHGNYFGIYSLVNYLGNLTSDVRFEDKYVDKDGKEATDGTTYYSYKSNNHTSSSRNYGQSLNQVALASGVFLELTTEKSTEEHKDYGYITGVVELDLINVKAEHVGGGFVYAKNEHLQPSYDKNKENVLLSEYNKESGNKRDDAITYKRYSYSGASSPWETSGNFIHHSKRIVDDCYPTNNAYDIKSSNYSEAHYWYVKGDVYIYDQTVSAYTGSASAYSRAVHLPLTITAASHGQLQLLNVKPNLYAYYTVKSNGEKVKIGTMDGTKELDKVWVNNDNDGYGLNEVVTWWDWHQMSPTDRSYFVPDTYVNTAACTIDGTAYAAGAYVMLPDDLSSFKTAGHTVTNSEGKAITDLDDLFRSSNNIGHDTGYLLTLDMDTPGMWDDRYIEKTGSEQITKAGYEGKSTSEKSDWIEGPTFTPVATGIYGQRQIEVGDVVTTETVERSTAGTGDQALMEPAYVSATAQSYTYGTQSKTVNAGSAIPQTEWEGIGSPSAFQRAYLCTQTVKLDETHYLLYGELKTQTQIDKMKTDYPALATQIGDAMKLASICTTAGGFGGQNLTAGNNYSALENWCLFSTEDRINSNGTYKFSFNHDAFDVLSDPSYLDGTKTVGSTSHGDVYQNPPHDVTVAAYQSPYTDAVGVEYVAVFHKKDNVTSVEYNDNGVTKTVTDGQSLTNTQYETVRNDRRHYTRVMVASGGETFYFAKDNFMYNGVPYGKGQVVDKEIYDNNASKVERVTIPNAGSTAAPMFYRYETYEGDQLNKEVISLGEYNNLTNDQQYFTIQGKEPTETTTLYVSRESDLKDVMSNRVYTVVYQYTYYEDEDDGSIKQTNELHVINIRIELESGAPTIGMLYPPSTVLPGAAVGLTRPDVKPGVYEVITSGWELFDDYNDAIHHRNGADFVNNGTPVYWYQNQKNYVAFYSKTYLGKAYSNPVALSVANYHDLDAVMNDKEHHLYVDHPDVDRASKIYIDNRTCQSDNTKSELDLLKDFYDLSEGTTLEGHSPLNSRVKGGANLEFFLNSNVSPKKYTDWTPIGQTGKCFEGNLHGDGYTVSGLNKSLFGSLCGSVFNLGVTGSFTTAGVADTGDGFVENCWVRSSATALPSGATPVEAVFGNPTASGCLQIVNCYYPEQNRALYTDRTTSPRAGGNARMMADRAFYNGEVAYCLNGFYLAKRYYQGTGLNTGTAYNYLHRAADGTLPADMSTGYYPTDYAYYKPSVKVAEGETLPKLGYVESRFYDGDFVYASGRLPESSEVRLRVAGEGNDAKTYYTPIWPDDYIFFGQALNYDHVDGRYHQDTPSHIVKSGDRIQTDAYGNRVYRAPAYFRDSRMGVAHFNPAAVFAQSKNGDPAQVAYQGMTAIDFSGYQDAGYESGWNNGYFYQPLLDDGGLTSFLNADLTKNLLVYTKTGTAAAAATDAVVSDNLHDQAYTETDATYRTVAPWDRFLDNVHGHWVQQQSNGQYVAPRDHMLVDEQDFNAPIAYTMDTGKRMWFQPFSVRFVDLDKGWEAFSLPFQATIVTTNAKGELTHFYEGSETGHEYWLRQFTGNVQQKEGTVYTADFSALTAGNNTKDYTNTFLWDYYYSKDSYQDKNTDKYQQHYYSEDYLRRTYPVGNYPYAQAGAPCIVGFPGSRYYEFDLSGQWTPKNRVGNATIASPGRQTITFASAEGCQIAVSDTELQQQKVTAVSPLSGYSFVPSYLNQSLEAGTDNYVLSADGSAFNKVPDSGDAVQAVAFRPYFSKTVASARQAGVQSILFSHNTGSLEGTLDPHDGDADGTLIIKSQKHKVVVTSALAESADVTIVNAAGVTVTTFTIEPGQTIETRLPVSGVYIVRTTDGRHQKKLAIK